MYDRRAGDAEVPLACPFLALVDDRDVRLAAPDRRHRCYAEPEPAPRAIAHQQQYCLTASFAVCPTFQDWARREAARVVDEGGTRVPTGGGAGEAAARGFGRAPAVGGAPGRDSARDGATERLSTGRRFATSSGNPAEPGLWGDDRAWAAPPPWARADAGSSGADVASPSADVASPSADAAPPSADVASPGTTTASAPADARWADPRMPDEPPRQDGEPTRLASPPAAPTTAPALAGSAPQETAPSDLAAVPEPPPFLVRRQEGRSPADERRAAVARLRPDGLELRPDGVERDRPRPEPPERDRRWPEPGDRDSLGREPMATVVPPARPSPDLRPDGTPRPGRATRPGAAVRSVVDAGERSAAAERSGTTARSGSDERWGTGERRARRWLGRDEAPASLGGGAPAWERPLRRDAYPDLRTRVGLPHLPRLWVGVIALVVAGLVLFFAPTVLPGLFTGQPVATPPPAPTPTVVPSVSLAPTPPPAPTPIVYTVVQGDTLSGIAARYGLTVSELLKANPQIKNANMLAIGDRITIPAKGASEGGAGAAGSAAP